MADASEFQQSHVAFLQNMQLQAPQMGASFSRAQVPFGNLDLNSQHEGYLTPDAMMLANSTSLRSMGIQGIQNSSDVLGGDNVGSNYAQMRPATTTLKRKTNSQDDTAAGWKSFVRGDPGTFSSTSLPTFGHGYALYDERYQVIGLPVDPHLRIFNGRSTE